MDAGLFRRNPDFQLRAFGASAPVVFLSRKLSSSRSRHPVIVTGAAGAGAWGSADRAIVGAGADAASR
jgi:hypothetical protein